MAEGGKATDYGRQLIGRSVPRPWRHGESPAARLDGEHREGGARVVWLVVVPFGIYSQRHNAYTMIRGKNGTGKTSTLRTVVYTKVP